MNPLNNKDVYTLIHDTNTQLGLIDSTVYLLKKEINEDKMNKEEFVKRLDNIKNYKNNLIKIIDIYYKSLKENEQRKD